MKHYPEDSVKMPSVQYAALIADLVVATKKTIRDIKLENDASQSGFVHLRMRTKQDTEMIVTDYTAPGTGNEYILVAIQDCNFEPEILEDEEAEK